MCESYSKSWITKFTFSCLDFGPSFVLNATWFTILKTESSHFTYHIPFKFRVLLIFSLRGSKIWESELRGSEIKRDTSLGGILYWNVSQFERENQRDELGMRYVISSYFRRIMSSVLLLVTLMITMPSLYETTFVITARKRQQPPRELTPAERLQWEQEQEHENMVMKTCSGYDEFAPCSCAEVLINIQV